MAGSKQLEGSDSRALEDLYRRHAGWLRRRLGRRVGPDLAADLVQETYIRIAPYEAAAIRHPRSLLMRIANNLLLDQRRREVRHDAYVAAEPVQTASPPAQVEALRFKAMLGAMNPLYRDVFVLSRFGGMTYPQIARTLGISAKTVEWRMSRALEHCLSQLEP